MPSLPQVSQGPALYDVIRSELDEAGRLPTPGFRLPDETDDGGIRWAPGAFDGVMGHHAGADPGSRVQAIVSAFAKACRRPTRRRLARLYDPVKDPGALEVVDPMIEQLAESGLPVRAVLDIGHWLATTASDRGAVKVGIAVLGAAGSDEHLPVIRAIGAHEEFTLYAAVALANGLEQPESELWALAAATDGWGRIECVDRLRGTDDAAIKRWLLRGGYRNSIMYEYLAYAAASTGDLRTALEADEVDRELLTCAGEIIQALIAGGPAEDMSDYADGATVVGRYLELVTRSAETLTDYRTITAVARFLASDDDWDSLATLGWTATVREALERRCEELVGRASWGDVVRAGLRSSDTSEFWMADQAALDLGIDTYDLHVDRLREDPYHASWYEAWRGAGADRAPELAELTRELLPLNRIATGAADELGFGPGWRAHSALDWTLQALRDHPGVGGDLLVTGLASPVTRNRNMALQALKAWPRDLWPASVEGRVARMVQEDPSESVRDNAADAMAGG